MLGLPSVVRRGTQHELNLPQLLNTIHRLLRLRRSDQQTLEELRTRFTFSPAGRLTLSIISLSLQRGRSDVLMQTEIADRLKARLTVT